MSTLPHVDLSKQVIMRGWGMEIVNDTCASTEVSDGILCGCVCMPANPDMHNPCLPVCTLASTSTHYVYIPENNWILISSLSSEWFNRNINSSTASVVCKQAYLYNYMVSDYEQLITASNLSIVYYNIECH